MKGNNKHQYQKKKDKQLKTYHKNYKPVFCKSAIAVYTPPLARNQHRHGRQGSIQQNPALVGLVQSSEQLDKGGLSWGIQEGTPIFGLGKDVEVPAYHC